MKPIRILAALSLTLVMAASSSLARAATIGFVYVGPEKD